MILFAYEKFLVDILGRFKEGVGLVAMERAIYCIGF
jgi:hypothetical protein